MSNKASPSQFDSYVYADEDEETFTLLARDPTAPYLVEIWAALRQGDMVLATEFLRLAFHYCERKVMPVEQIMEAHQTATKMHLWRKAKK